MSKQESLYQLLRKYDVFSEDTLERYRYLNSEKLWEVLISNYYINEYDLLTFYAQYNDAEFQALQSYNIDTALQSKFKDANLDYLELIPLYQEKNKLHLALSNPYKELPPQLEKYNIKKLLVLRQDIQHYFQDNDTIQVTFNVVLEEALRQKASDIHCFKRQDRLDIFFRSAGQLTFFNCLRHDEQQAFTEKIKLHAHMDLSNSKTAQDGHLIYKTQDKQIDTRVSTLPTVFGEDVVLRLYQKQFNFRSLADLGVTKAIEKQLLSMLTFTNGLILVTGPTGSGKTTTLYTLLMLLKQQQRGVIVTLEDPVEMIIDGIRQSSINSALGYDYASGLKAILRQDPDVIMIGEIRDAQTAKIALEAAYTGHLVLATLHTADVKSTLLRLSSFGVDPFLLNHCLRGVVAQKLETKCDLKGRYERVLLQESLLVDEVPEDDKMMMALGCYDLDKVIGFL